MADRITFLLLAMCSLSQCFRTIHDDAEYLDKRADVDCHLDRSAEVGHCAHEAEHAINGVRSMLSEQRAAKRAQSGVAEGHNSVREKYNEELRKWTDQCEDLHDNAKTCCDNENKCEADTLFDEVEAKWEALAEEIGEK